MQEKEKTYYEVSTQEELLEKMKERKHYILIKDELQPKVKELLKTTFSDEELMGAELGSGGTVGFFAEILYQIISYFNKKSKMDRKLESAIRQYKYKIEDENVLLYHRQLDY